MKLNKFHQAILPLMVGAVSSVPISAYDLTKDKVQYICAFAHLDAQFLWTWETSITEYVPNSLRDNFILMDKYPEYVFNFTGAWKYMQAKSKFPALYEKLKKYVQRRQFIPAGMLLEDLDLIIPSPESFIRHALYGYHFFIDEFGYTTQDLLLPDEFGFPITLPTLAAHCNFIGLSTQKLSWGSSVNPLPFITGVWEGIDGSQILACLGGSDYWSSWEIREEHINQLGKDNGIWAAFDYFAPRSDRGGAPPEPQVKSMCERINRNNTETIKLITGPSDTIFRDLMPYKEKLTKYKGELLLRSHGVGCYSGRAFMKQWNRLNEQATLAAEAASVIAMLSANVSYPADTIKNASIRYLWHQMHDDITGTAIPEAYTKFSIPDEQQANSTLMSILQKAIASTAKLLDTRSDRGVGVVVFNSLGYPRTDLVEVEIEFPTQAPSNICVIDPFGVEHPAQILSKNGNRMTILFNATVASVGYTVYRVVEATDNSTQTELSIDLDKLENKRYRVGIDQNGDICSIFDKKLNKEILAEPARLQMLYNAPPSFPMWEIDFDQISAPPLGYVDEAVQKKVTEKGPVRVSLEVSREKEGSKFIQTYSLSLNSDYLEVKTFLNWNTNGRLCKAAFKFTASNPKATYDLGIGTIERGNNTSNLYEVPAQQWAAIDNSKGDFGVGIMNDCKYGWDKPSNNMLRMTLVHFPDNSAWRDPNGDVLPFTQTFKYAVAGYEGDWKKGCMVEKASRFNRPLVAIQEAAHEGKFGRQLSLLHIGSSQVALMALKKAEKSSDIIVRVRETNGTAIDNVVISFASKVKSAKEVYGIEIEKVPAIPVIVDNNTIRFSMKKYEIKSFSVSLEKMVPPFMAVESDMRSHFKSSEKTIIFSAKTSAKRISIFLRDDEQIQTASILQATGKEIRRLIATNSTKLLWDGNQKDGTPAAAGMYLLKIKTNYGVRYIPFGFSSR